MMCRPMQPIALPATRALGTAACRPRPWCCSSWQPYGTVVRLCSVQVWNSAKNISKYIETPTPLTARGCSPLEKRVQHHSEGMLFPRLSLHANTRVRPNGTWRKGFLRRSATNQKSVSTKRRARSRRVVWSEHNLRYHAALRRIGSEPPYQYGTAPIPVI